MRRILSLALLLGAAAALPAAQQPPPLRAAIAGQVLDDRGDPVVNARVMAQAIASGAAPRMLAATTTDDRGEYGLSGVPAGECVVAVVRPPGALVMPSGFTLDASPGPRRAPPIIYYPGTTATDEAERLSLAAGEEKGRIDFVLSVLAPSVPPVAALRIAQAGPLPPNPAATASIAGRVTTIDGRAVPHAQVQLIPAVDVLLSRATAADADGRYEFRDVAPGTLTVAASKAGSPSSRTIVCRIRRGRHRGRSRSLEATRAMASI